MSAIDAHDELSELFGSVSKKNMCDSVTTMATSSQLYALPLKIEEIWI